MIYLSRVVFLSPQSGGSAHLLNFRRAIDTRFGSGDYRDRKTSLSFRVEDFISTALRISMWDFVNVAPKLYTAVSQGDNTGRHFQTE